MEYYHRFTRRFPALESLAGASEDEVLREWQGLGYYSRARNMLSAARYIRDELDCRFPDTFEGIRSLKGVGDYTASCIASISFGLVHAAVDGNVYRVLSRLFADPVPIDSTAGRQRFKSLAGELISKERPGDFNEAMMDLGAMVCTPRNPKCGECPLSASCVAFARGTQMLFPLKSPAAKKRLVILNYLDYREANRIFLRRREGKGIWKGLYELPVIEGEMQVAELESGYFSGYGLHTGQLTEVARTRHLLSHIELDIRFYQPAATTPGTVAGQLIEADFDRIGEYPFPKPLVDYLSGV